MTGKTDPSVFVDTHAHLCDDQFNEDAGAVIERAASIGVRQIVNVAFSQRMWGEARDLSLAHQGVTFSLGVHPNSAGEWNLNCRNELERLADEWKPVAIGETGLDYYWSIESREVQLAAFREQLAIARSARLPVIIHMRGDVEVDIRNELAGPDQPACIFHSFDGSPELAAWIVERGWLLGVGGLMTRRSAHHLQTILGSIPEDHLLLETDSPYLAPSNWPQKRNSPESIPLIAGHLARVRQTTVESVASVTTTNARRILNPVGESAVRPPSRAP